MRFDIVTIFPDMIGAFAREGVVGRAIRKKKMIAVNAVNPRDFTTDNHKTVDDRPFGGGPGMVLKALPVLKAVDKALRFKIQDSRFKEKKVKIIILSPRGKKFDDQMAKKLAKHDQLILISGRYEGIDTRVKKVLRAEEVSIGDYVLSGGELPAMIIVDAVARKIPGVLGKEESLEEKRVASGEMYTRPEVLEWKGKKYRAPKVLMSGNHQKIEEWRERKSL
jgi:tRNA (guanine37-N1)-methyltransferase